MLRLVIGAAKANVKSSTSTSTRYHRHHHHHVVTRGIVSASSSSSSSSSTATTTTIRRHTTTCNNNNNNKLLFPTWNYNYYLTKNNNRRSFSSSSSSSSKDKDGKIAALFDTLRRDDDNNNNNNNNNDNTKKKKRKKQKKPPVVSMNRKSSSSTTTSTFPPPPPAAAAAASNPRRKRKLNNKNKHNKNKPKTLDDFFSNMGIDKDRQQKQKQQQRQRRFRQEQKESSQQQQDDDNNKNKMRDLFSSSSSSPIIPPLRNKNSSDVISQQQREEGTDVSNNNTNSKKKTRSSTDLVSFFDQVDAIVKERKTNKKTTRITTNINNTSSSENDTTTGKNSSVQNNNTTSTEKKKTTKKELLSFVDIIGSPSSSASTTSSTRRQQQQSDDETTNYYYDDDCFEEYMEILEPILDDPKFLRKYNKDKEIHDKDAESIIEWLTSDQPIIPYVLPTLQNEVILASDTTNTTETSSSLSSEAVVEQEKQQQFQLELRDQRTKLMDYYGWDQKQYGAAVGALLQVGNMCARNASAGPIDIAWEKFKEAGYLTNQKSITNCLYVSSTFAVQQLPSSLLSSSTNTNNTNNYYSSSGGSILDFLDDDDEPSIKTTTTSNHNNNTFGGGDEYEYDSDDDVKNNGRDDTTSGDESGVDIACEIALCHDLLFGPSEQSTSIRVRALVAQGKPHEAEQLLNNNPTGDDLRLRAYSPVFQCYLNQGDVAAAFHLFTRMSQGKNVQMHSNLYVQMIAGIAENGYFRQASEPIPGIKDLGYTADCGPELLDQLALEMSNVAVEIPSASAKRLYNAFQSGFEGMGEPHNLKRLHLLQSLIPCNDKAASNELVASRVSLDESTGKCPRTGARLRLINLNAEQKQQLRNGLMYLSSTLYEERFKEKNSYAEDELRRFGEWLQNRKGKPFTAIIDGPNVAYYMQNFDQGTFNYHQIKFVMETLENMGENVLVILPERYTWDSFMLQSLSATGTGKPRRQRLTEQDKQILQELVSSGKIYIVKKRCMDDHYWMYASVSGPDDMYIPPGNEEGRWPGIRPMLVSNDKLRDHKLSLLEPRLFRRWYSNFMVNFTFSAFFGDRSAYYKEIGFSTADFYSREIQGNPTFDETTNQECGTAWHFPVSDWEAHESFCIRIPKAVR